MPCIASNTQHHRNHHNHHHPHPPPSSSSPTHRPVHTRPKTSLAPWVRLSVSPLSRRSVSPPQNQPIPILRSQFPFPEPNPVRHRRHHSGLCSAVLSLLSIFRLLARMGPWSAIAKLQSSRRGMCHGPCCDDGAVVGTTTSPVCPSGFLGKPHVPTDAYPTTPSSPDLPPALQAVP